MANKIAGKGEKSNDRALNKAVKANATRKDSILGIARLALHNAWFSLLGSHSKRRQRVGNQVNPQKVGRLKNSKANQGCNKDGNNLCKVGAQEELDTLTNVVVDASSLFTRANDGGKVIVSQNHICNALSNIGTSNAHTNTNISAFNGRSIINAVTCHGRNHALLAPGINNADLVLRLNTCINANCLNTLLKLFVRNLIKLCAGNCLRAIGNNAQLNRNSNGRINVIACNHNGTHTSTMRLCNSTLNLRTNWVNHAGKSNKDHVMLKVSWVIALRSFCSPVTTSRCHNAKSLVSHGLVLSQNLRAGLIGEVNNAITCRNLGAASKHLIRRTFGVLYNFARASTHHNRHHLTNRVKGRLANARTRRSKVTCGVSKFCSVCNKSSFGWLTLCNLLRIVPGSVTAQCHGTYMCIKIFCLMTDNSHLVLGQSTGLIRADNLSTTKGLNCSKTTDNSVALAHSGNAHRKNDGNNSNKTLWNCSYCKRNCNHKRA